jgi:hypothetical protein
METKDTEKLVYPKALKCFRSLKEAIEAFENILKKDSQQSQTNFYRAKRFLREGEDFFRESMKNARRLLGPLPEYVTSDYKNWRENLLDEYNMLAKTEEEQELEEELIQDEFLNKLMDKEEIRKFLSLNYASQQEGKRKLSNIKVRIIFDKLDELLAEAKDLQKRILSER